MISESFGIFAAKGNPRAAKLNSAVIQDCCRALKKNIRNKIKI
jgi:hypothetical protein